MKTCDTCVHFRPDGDWKKTYPKHMENPGDCDFPLPVAVCDSATSQMDGADEVDCPCWARKSEPLPTGPGGKCCQVCLSWSAKRLHCNEPQTWQQEMRNGVDCEFFRGSASNVLLKHVRETTFGVAPNPANALRDLLRGDPASLEAIGDRLGAASPVKLDEASFDEAARVLERPALRCHVCGAATEKTYTFERTYENKDYQARTMRFSGIGLCDGCAPRTQDDWTAKEGT